MAPATRPGPSGDEPTEKLDPSSTTEDPMNATEHENEQTATAPGPQIPDDDAPAPTHEAAGVPVPDRPGLRVGTVVWGLVLAAVGLGVLALASGLVFDVELAFIGLVAVAGLALLVGSLINGARRSRR